MLNLDLIQKEYGFMGDTVFLNVSQVVVPPKRVQDAYRKFMDDYVSNFGIDIVSRAWDIVNNTRSVYQVSKLVVLDETADPIAKAWVERNYIKAVESAVSVLANKKLSVIGDSISTFAGYIPEADGFNLKHLARYPQDNLLTDVNETWWMQVSRPLSIEIPFALPFPSTIPPAK